MTGCPGGGWFIASLLRLSLGHAERDVRKERLALVVLPDRVARADDRLVRDVRVGRDGGVRLVGRFGHLVLEALRARREARVVVVRLAVDRLHPDGDARAGAVAA